MRSFQRLNSEVKAEYLKSKKRYGSPRIAIELEKRGTQASKSTVARVMKSMGLRSIAAKKFKATTNSKHGLPVARNILDRNFEQEKLNKVWVSDITYIRVNRR
jgi:transposase InsO family protein